MDRNFSTLTSKGYVDLHCGFSLEDNYFTWQAFGRRYDHENRKALPDYLKEENYQTLREMVDRVETHVASLGDYLKSAEPNSLNGFILLDSQDWMPPEVIDELWSLIAKVGADDTRVIFRTAGDKIACRRGLLTLRPLRHIPLQQGRGTPTP